MISMVVVQYAACINTLCTVLGNEDNHYLNSNTYNLRVYPAAD